MIVIWVTELFMNQLGALRSSNTSYLHVPQYLELQNQFDKFLAIPKVEVFRKKDQVFLLNFIFLYLIRHRNELT